jgi:hypothetical protein
MRGTTPVSNLIPLNQLLLISVLLAVSVSSLSLGCPSSVAACNACRLYTPLQYDWKGSVARRRVGGNELNLPGFWRGVKQLENKGWEDRSVGVPSFELADDAQVGPHTLRFVRINTSTKQFRLDTSVPILKKTSSLHYEHNGKSRSLHGNQKDPSVLPCWLNVG